MRASHGEHGILASLSQRMLAASALAATMALGIYGCGGKDTGKQQFFGTPTGTGGVQIQATDAAFPYPFLSSANVQLASASLDRSDGTHTFIVSAGVLGALPGGVTSETFAAVNSSSILVNNFNLLALKNGNTVTVENGVALIGTYQSVTVTVTDMFLTLSDGRVLTPTNPMPTTMVLPLMPGLSLNQSDFKTILIDFDLARSVAFVGSQTINNVNQITGYTFIPQGRAVILENVGQIQGIVSDTSNLPAPNSEVELTSSGAVIATTPTDVNGGYTFLGLQPGTYGVIALSGEVAGISSAVTVSQNNTTQQNLTLNQPAPVNPQPQGH
jgi:hypothetical protein